MNSHLGGAIGSNRWGTGRISLGSTALFWLGAPDETRRSPHCSACCLRGTAAERSRAARQSPALPGGAKRSPADPGRRVDVFGRRPGSAERRGCAVQRSGTESKLPSFGLRRRYWFQRPVGPNSAPFPKDAVLPFRSSPLPIPANELSHRRLVRELNDGPVSARFDYGVHVFRDNPRDHA
jgi:hypothetical protein